MSLLIENDLIWLANPKCAAKSIYQALINSDLNVVHSIEFDKIAKMHKWDGYFSMVHLRLDYLKEEFGNKKSFCVTRNHLDRFLSAISYIYDDIEYYGLMPIMPYNEIDNEYIYNLITTDFMFKLESGDFLEVQKCFIKDSPLNEVCALPIPALYSNSYMKAGIKVDYEFDISELDKLEFFLSERYHKSIIIPKLNGSKNKVSKIVKNKELNWFIWERFEKKFHEKTLI